MALLREFGEFLEEYDIVGLAIALVIGLAVKDLVNALVDDLVMPLVALVLPGGDWESSTVELVGAELATGHFLSVLIEFVIIALLIFLAVKYVMGREVEKY